MEQISSSELQARIECVEHPEQNQLFEVFPELELLKKIIENNQWHKQESVYHHTLNIRKEMDAILELKFIENKEVREKLQSYLERKFDVDGGFYTRRFLLKFATLVHDIGKIDTFIVEPEGITSCPNHESVGIKKIPTIAKRFNMTEREIEYLVCLVGYHTQASVLSADSSSKNEVYMKEKVEIFKKNCNGCFIDLILLVFADHISSYLAIADPKKYKDIEEFLVDLVLEQTQYL
ncbi:MAG: HD domain-containing protein [Candidatus Bathyarchaeota archaeon]|jgi:hypothetical protein